MYLIDLYKNIIILINNHDYSHATNKPPSPEFIPIIVGTFDSCLKSVNGWLQRNASWFESHGSTTGGNTIAG